MRASIASEFGALFWWRALCVLAALNVCVWLALWQFGPRAGAHAGRAGGRRYLSIGQGLRDAWTRREPELGWDKWRDDAAWLTPYFSLGVWCSLVVVVLPRAL